ncbi:MAG: ribonuclease E/G, partial [Pseudomonadota bacterium]
PTFQSRRTDFESENKRQLAGNIYLAKVSRVEPSLQAAFVEYGGNRHGFLAFSEIHPDYYQIPVADREALLAEERAYAEAQAAEDEVEKPKRSRRRRKPKAEAEAVTSDDAVETKEVASEDIPGMGVVDLDDGDDIEDAAQSPIELVKDTPVDTPAADEEPAVEEASEAAPEAVSDAPEAETAEADEAARDDTPTGDATEDDTPADDASAEATDAPASS